MKLQDFIKLIAIYAEDNKAIRRFHFDFADNLGQISSEDDQFPLLYLEVTSSSNLDNPLTGYKGSEFGFNIFIVDTINRSRSNILSILNDCELIMQDIKGYIESISGIMLQDGGLFIEPLNNAYYDNLAGMTMRLTIQVDGGDDCAVSYTECTPITLEFMNTIGDLITRRNLCVSDNDIEVVVVPNGKINVSVNGDFKELIDVPSGATISYDIEVGDGEVILYNTEGEELTRRSVAPDSSVNLIAPDSSVNLNVNDTLWVTLSVPSLGTLDVTIPQSDWTENDINDPSYIKNKPTIPTPIDEFIELNDTPNDYTNQAGKIVAVKSDESGLEFITGGGSGTQVQSNWAETDSGEMSYILNKPDLSGFASVIYVDNEISNLNIPTAISQLANDSGFITLAQVPVQVNADWDAVSGVAQILNKPNLSGYASVTYVDNAIGNLSIPTKTSDLTNDNGFITSSALTGLATETYVNNQISAINIPTATSDLINDDGFITLAEVPNQVNADWDAVSGVSQILNKPDLSGYATQTYVNTQISAINLPTKTSDLTNDNGFITSSALTGLASETYVNNQISAIVIPTKTSDLTNDSNFQTNTQMWNYVTDVTNKVTIVNITADTSLTTGGHYGRFIISSNALPITITVPTNATMPFQSGTRIDGYALESDVIFSPASGVTIVSEDSNLTATEHTGWSLIKTTGTDTWILVGKLK